MPKNADITWDEAVKRSEAYQRGRQDAIDYDGSPDSLRRAGLVRL